MTDTIPIQFTAASDLRRLVEGMEECGCVTVSPYTFCGFHCRYCITGAPGVAEPLGTAEELVARMRSDLALFDPDLLVGLGGMRDAYPAVEATTGLTRALLAELRALHRRVTVITKGATIVRDIDLLLADPVGQVTISLCSLDAARLAPLEPGVPSVEERLDVIATLAQAGVRTSVSVAPWIPGLTDVLAITRAVRARAGKQVWIVVGPLNVRSALVVGSRFTRSWTQLEINEQYRQARDAAPYDPGTTWMPEVPLTGPHTSPGPIVGAESCAVPTVGAAG